MSASVIASSVIALLVALFNLVLAVHWLSPAPLTRSRLAFAAAPAGLFVFAAGWFLLAVNPALPVEAGAFGGAGVLLAMGGFAVDALLVEPGPTGRRVAALALVVLPPAIASAAVCIAHNLSSTIFVPRAVAMTLVFAVLALRIVGRNRGTDADRKLSRDIVAVILLAAFAAVLLYLYAALRGHWRADPALPIALVAECLVLVYIVDRRVEVHVLLSRGATWTVFALAVALATGYVFVQLGYAIDLVQVTVTVVIALLAALLFMGVGDRMATRIVAVLFPEQARLAARLALSRAEATLLRRRLERAERLAIAGELAASVAHEIKNPLAALRGYSQLLAGCADQVSPPAKAQFEKALRVIQEESDRIDARVAEMLTLGKNARPQLARDGRLDLNRVVADAVAVAEGDPSSSPIVVGLQPISGAVVGDEDEIRAAVANLLKNALEASAESRRAVEVRTRMEQGKAVVEILDEGVGLTAQDVESLFRPFRTTKKGGTGLGLVIAKSAVEGAGGRVSLEPRADRRGARARIELEVAS